MSDIFGALGISASGMSAERLRLDVTSANLANADTTRGANGQPYVRQEVSLESGGVSAFSNVLTGVQVAGIVNDPSPPRRVYEPNHPDAKRAMDEISKLEGTAKGTPLRDDVVVRNTVVGDVLAGAPDPDPPYFRVPKVIDR